MDTELELELQEARQSSAVYGEFAGFFLSPLEKADVSRAVALMKVCGVSAPYFEADEQVFTNHFVVGCSPTFIPALESSLRGLTRQKGKLIVGSMDNRYFSEVTLCYQTYGFSPRKLTGFKPLVSAMRADYIGAELAFMSYLREIESRGGTQGLAAGTFADTFLTRHLTQWMDPLKEYAYEKSEDFYAALIDALAVWVEIDSQEQVPC